MFHALSMFLRSIGTLDGPCWTPLSQRPPQCWRPPRGLGWSLRLPTGQRYRWRYMEYIYICIYIYILIHLFGYLSIYQMYIYIYIHIHICQKRIDVSQTLPSSKHTQRYWKSVVFLGNDVPMIDLPQLVYWRVPIFSGKLRLLYRSCWTDIDVYIYIWIMDFLKKIS